ncbi:biosynthetic-type acetolactate synthase large subunit [Anaerolineae bacterium CFX9]|jgi:acetolactate synthase-1/2/3 large subunit|nr:biosynthetic-type acetolactate synthase large subunit [Geitlerinema splendidum]MDK3160617.1 biosynthetic-type acetolactate synthase large subunit [Kamptonema cortianum]MDL1901660.1 biosynthetic-type acetolactate synthase large subunit [Anaerolineae bacterium CFX9]
MGKILNGAEILMECLLREGVDVIFGYPGGAILPAYDALTKYPQIHHVLVRHEQGASHMADGYARATGKVGVAMATSGPGATNLVTGIATAMMDSSPIVCITGQVPRGTIGSDAFQETDVTGVTLPVTKHNYLVMDIHELPYIIKEAFYIARSGRPGPVLIDIPKDIQTEKIEFVYPEGEPRLPGYRPPQRAEESDVQRALELIHEAQRPIILAGHGILMSGAMSELRELAERAQIPVALTLLGKGAIPEDHPLTIGMMGMHGEAASNYAIQDADLLIALGMRFDDRVTGNLKTYAPHARKIHVDIDPSEINKNVRVDVGMVGDLKTVLNQLLPGLQSKTHPEWLNRIRDWQEDSDERDIIKRDIRGTLLGAQVINDLWRFTGGEAITVSDVGQHQMLEAQYYPHQRPRTMITSGGLGTMGFGLPAAIGAKFGCPDEEVWAIVGDGGFQMTLCELATAKQENVGVKIAIINNNFLGMVRQWQELFYEERYSATPMFNPDFVKLAEAYGIPAMRVTEREQIEESVRFARSHEGPVLIEYMVQKEEMVYPMVPAGADLHAMIRRPKPEEEK